MTSVLGEKLREAIEKKNLATTINQWDDEDSATKQNIKDIPVLSLANAIAPKKHTFSITTNASRATFDFVKQNPCMYTTIEVARELGKQGQKQNTVSSLVSQMVRNGILYRTKSGTVGALVNEYEPIKSPKTLRNIQKREAAKEGIVETPKRKIVIIKKTTGHKVEVGGGAGIAALKQETNTAAWSVDAVVDGLTLTQGRALYLKLKEIFGG